MGQGDSLSQEFILCIEVYRDRKWLEVSQQIAVPWRGTSWVPFELFCMYACMGSRFSHVWLFETLWTVAQQAILSMGSPGKNREWVTLPSFKGSSRSRDRTLVTCTASRFLTTEPQGKPIQFSSITQLCPTMQPHELQHTALPESTQTHVHWVGNAIQPSHPIVPFFSCPQSFPASGSFQMSQFFALGAKVLEFQLQHHSFQWTPRTALL